MEWNGIALSVGDALGRPATVKCRIGVDDADSYEGTCMYVHQHAHGISGSSIWFTIPSPSSPCVYFSHVMLLHFILYHFKLCHIISYYLISYYFISYYLISYHFMSFNPTSLMVGWSLILIIYDGSFLRFGKIHSRSQWERESRALYSACKKSRSQC